MPGVVLQSHRQPLPAPWLADCVQSVKHWAETQKLGYQWLGDELFEPVPATLLAKTAGQRVVATDLARLLQLERLLAEGFDPVIWIDADVYVVAPERLQLPATSHAFGREYWLQRTAKAGLRTYRRLHNAVLVFRAGDPVLPFYRFAAQRILERYEAEGMVPQLLGPKLISALNSVAHFCVLETAAMLPPLVATALRDGDRALIEMWSAGHEQAPAAVNLCASLQSDADAMQAVLSALDARELVRRL